MRLVILAEHFARPAIESATQVENKLDTRPTAVENSVCGRSLRRGDAP